MGTDYYLITGYCYIIHKNPDLSKDHIDFCYDYMSEDSKIEFIENLLGKPKKWNVLYNEDDSEILIFYKKTIQEISGRGNEVHHKMIFLDKINYDEQFEIDCKNLEEKISKNFEIINKGYIAYTYLSY